jgi:exonuclease III
MLPTEPSRKKACTVLRIVSWNVALSLRTKWPALTALTPDLAILPEVARADLEALVPDTSQRDWIGDNDKKGLGVVTFGDYTLARDACWDAKHQFFLPARITGPTRFNLLAVWALNHRNRGELAGQRDATLQAITHYRDFLGQSAHTIVAGDFNHNVIWDKPRATRANFRPVLDALESLGLVSAYHQLHSQPHGQESAHTLNWRHRTNTPYHVDYIFAPKASLSAAARLQIVAPGTGDPLSDHLALVLDLP